MMPQPEWMALMDGIALLAIFVLAVFVGFEVVVEGVQHAAHAADVRRERDPRHHPGRRDPRRPGSADDAFALVVGLLAVVLATVNLVGGFVVTDRMLEMFKGRRPAPVDRNRLTGSGGERCWTPPPTEIGYLVAAVCFILALKGLSSPRTARRGNLIGALGALIALVTVFLSTDLDHRRCRSWSRSRSGPRWRSRLRAG